MPDQAWASLAAVLASLAMQMVKDHVGISKGILPLVALFAGAIASAATALSAGMDAEAVAVSGGTGGLIATGTHAVALGNSSLLGRLLKAIGASIFNNPSTPQTPTPTPAPPTPPTPTPPTP